nr:uncharacterized protein LOC117278067 isoform X1 [Nicotiana tomentosiformis]XP_033513378.1 uncharacterized protein LOC117278067 isoform X2 [Nicotiana tomentosiformis]
MKNTSNKTEFPTITFSELDLFNKLPKNTRKAPRQKMNNFASAGVKLWRDIGGARSRLETPLLRWKFNEHIHHNACMMEEKSSSELDRKCSRYVRSVVSARELAAGQFTQQLPQELHPLKPPQTTTISSSSVCVTLNSIFYRQENSKISCFQ